MTFHRFGRCAALATAAILGAAPAFAVTGGGALSEGVWGGLTITETATGAASGAYTLSNGSVSGVVYGFGVTNPVLGAETCIGACGDGFAGYDDTGFLVINGDGSAEFWGSIGLGMDDWSTYVPNAGEQVGQLGATMEELFGAWAWGSTDQVNWYEVFDASGVGAGMEATSLFFFAPAASEGFGLGNDSTGENSYFDLGELTVQSADVPLPAAAWMLLAGVGAMGAAARRKR